MKLLKAVGAFFVRIGRWVKDTAWVQPLLIVGAIFAVIFSIPSITDWVEGIAEDIKSSEKYYERFQRSLEGGESSEADRLLADIQEGESPVGDKFFLAFVSSECASCAEAKKGFETLESGWAGSLAPESDNLPFNLVTIFTDEVTDQTTTRESAFVQFLSRNSYFFEEAAGIAYTTDYYYNNKISDADLGYLESCDEENFLTPTILLVDFELGGVSEVMFGVTGDTDVKKAELLRDCWDHANDFTAD